MQPTFTEIKKAALSSLKSRWPEAIAAAISLVSVALLDTLMQMTLMSILKVDAVWSPFIPTSVPLYNAVASVGITVFSAVFSFTVSFPLLFGVMRWFWLVTGGSDPELGEIFCYFSSGKKFRKAMLISFGLFWRTVVAAVVSLLPCAICGMLLRPEVYNYFGYAMPLWVSALYPLVSIFKVIGIIIFVFWVLRYMLFYTVLFSEPQASAHKTLKDAEKVSGGQLIRLVSFICSFFGWALLCLLVLPVLFVLPYALASMSVYGREEYRAKKMQATADIQ